MDCGRRKLDTSSVIIKVSIDNITIMRNISYMGLVLLMAMVFAITGFNFEDPGFAENSKEYILLIMVVCFGIIYVIYRFANKNRP